MQELMTVFLSNAEGIVGGLCSLLLFLIFLIITLWSKLSKLEKRYGSMMQGADGKSLEEDFIRCKEEMRNLMAENKELRAETARLDAVLQTAITRVAVMRFRAFEDMGSDQSYAVALLDANHDGVILSSIFARELSRSYVKPIAAGRSEYTLSTEEKQVLREAMK